MIYTSASANVVFFLVLISGMYLCYRNPERIQEITPWSFFAAWLAVFLFDHYYLLDRSFIYPDDEGDKLIPFYKLLADNAEGAQYSHSLAAGHDIDASFLIGGTLLSFDGLLFVLLPIWLAILVHKGVVVALGFWGTFLVATRSLKCRAVVGAVYAALFTLADFRFLYKSFGTGLSWALLPLAIYVCVGRLDRPRYFLFVAAYAVVVAVFIIPTQGGLTLVFGILAGAVLLGRWSRRDMVKVSAALSLLLLAIAVNWAESIYGMLQMAPLSHLGIEKPIHAGPILERLAAYLRVSSGIFGFRVPTHIVITLSSAVGLALLFAFKAPDKWRSLAAILLLPAAYAAFNLFPWELLGIGFVRNVTSFYLMYAMVALGPLIAARGTEELARRRPAVAIAAALSVTVALMAWYKTNSVLLHFTSGGQSVYFIDNLEDKAWAPETPFRVITLRHKNLMAEPNVAAGIYGLDAFDMWLNFPEIEYLKYWTQGILPREGNKDVGISWAYWDNRHYDIGRQADLDLLAVANVRYVLSPLPLKGDNLVFVEGPEELPRDRAVMKMKRKTDFGERQGMDRQLRRLGDHLDRIAWQVARVFDFGDVYIYEIANALDRVYGATGVVVVPDDMAAADYYPLIAREALKGKAVVRESMAREADLSATPSLRVKDYALVKDGYDITLEAPEGGVVIVNASHFPFFTATAGARTLPLVPVNGVQMAIAVPPGTETLNVRYHRPTLAGKIERFLN